MRSRSVPAIIIFPFVCAAPASAHHSFAPHYDPNNIVTFAGTVTEHELAQMPLID